LRLPAQSRGRARVTESSSGHQFRKPCSTSRAFSFLGPEREVPADFPRGLERIAPAGAIPGSRMGDRVLFWAPIRKPCSTSRAFSFSARKGKSLRTSRGDSKGLRLPAQSRGRAARVRRRDDLVRHPSLSYDHSSIWLAWGPTFAAND